MDARKEGRKEGRKERSKEGRKDGKKEGWRDGRKEGRKEERKEGRRKGKIYIYLTETMLVIPTDFVLLNFICGCSQLEMINVFSKNIMSKMTSGKPFCLVLCPKVGLEAITTKL